MRHSKLINTIQILSKKELDGAKELLETNLLLKGSYKRECLNLFNYILLNYPNFENAKLDKETVSRCIYDKSSQVKINRVEKTMTALLQVIEYYIVNFLKKDKYYEVRENHHLAIFYRERKLFSRSETTLRKAKAALQEKEIALDTDYYFWKSALTEETIDLEDIKGKDLNKENLLGLFQAVNEHSVLKMLEWLSKIVIKRYYFEEYDLSVFHQLNNIVNEEPSYKNNPLLSLYLMQLWMFKTALEDDFGDYYEIYSKKFLEVQHSLDLNNVYSFSSRERSCLVYRYSKQPNQQNLRYLFDTYSRHLEAGTLLLNGRIYSSSAVNLINYAIKLGEIVWVKQFLETWKDKIGAHDDNHSEILHLCWAMYYFADKNYTKAEENINIHFDNIIYWLNAKRFRIKILFEREEFDKMYNDLEAFKVFLFRTIKPNKGISQVHFEWNNNFNIFLKQMYLLKFNPNAIKKAKLVQKLNSQVCSDKEWLLEKLAAIR